MALVARTRSRDHLLHGPGTLMACSLAAGLPVASACSGRGACGKCVVTLLQGMDLFPPPDDHEAAVLEKNAAGPAQRLSCQLQLPAGEADLLVTTGYW
ncbi:MAG: 2Fe-2S iron-sulfur cluster-binding protein [Holophagaceae bacterium]